MAVGAGEAHESETSRILPFALTILDVADSRFAILPYRSNMTTGEVVGGILLTGDQLLGVEQLTVGTGADLIDHGGLQIDEHGAGARA